MTSRIGEAIPSIPYLVGGGTTAASAAALAALAGLSIYFEWGIIALATTGAASGAAALLALAILYVGCKRKSSTKESTETPPETPTAKTLPKSVLPLEDFERKVSTMDQDECFSHLDSDTYLLADPQYTALLYNRYYEAAQQRDTAVRNLFRIAEPARIKKICASVKSKQAREILHTASRDGEADWMNGWIEGRMKSTSSSANDVAYYEIMGAKVTPSSNNKSKISGEDRNKRVQELLKREGKSIVTKRVTAVVTLKDGFEGTVDGLTLLHLAVIKKDWYLIKLYKESQESKSLCDVTAKINGEDCTPEQLATLLKSWTGSDVGKYQTMGAYQLFEFA